MLTREGCQRRQARMLAELEGLDSDLFVTADPQEHLLFQR